MNEIILNQDIMSFLEIYVTLNRGISWGIGGSSGTCQFLIISMLVFLVFIMFVWYISTTSLNKFSYASGLMIISGALSNFVDRIWYYGVVDFIHFYWGVYSFPVFNVADIFISIGTILMLYFYWLNEHVIR